jgi:uncharacterized circularly permuted ATP-grasp superfamily protein
VQAQTTTSGGQLSLQVSQAAVARAAFDEMTAASGVRPAYAGVRCWFESASGEDPARRHREAELMFRRIGVTFAVYSEGGDPERLIPFDMIPRVLSAEEWSLLARGLTQRVRALNAFLHDVYHEREMIRAGRIPAELVLRNEAFRPEMQGLEVPAGACTHVAGIDVVRTGPSEFFVLEDSGGAQSRRTSPTPWLIFPSSSSSIRAAPAAAASTRSSRRGSTTS